MIKLQLQKIDNPKRIGDRCEYVEPNVKESCLLYDEDELVGVYISDASKQFKKLSAVMKIANHEFLSDNVPKSLLERADVMRIVKEQGLTRAEAKKIGTVQYSTIIGSIPKKPLMRRSYHNRSSVHSVDSARTFCKAMLMASHELENAMSELVPELYKKHKEAMCDVQNEWLFGELYTSSISNYNIAAPFHRDRANVKNTLNGIYTVRHNATGGCLYVPDYDACFEMPSGSLLFYPAWRNVHSVTPIVPTHDGGYRNSLVFYSLSGFEE
tara:strand:- start:2829 stop:3635 length:807 start_codon:yes stop_codon:yes gene_type:complete